jgi:peptidoglycan/LPS O-acetylase OafA/YrhL
MRSRVFFLILAISLALVAISREVGATNKPYSQCETDLQAVYSLKYVSQAASAFMIDASGNSINELGKYEQCIYTMDDKKVQAASLCVLNYNVDFDGQQVPFKTGLCVPVSCNETSLMQLAAGSIAGLANVTHLPALTGALNVTSVYCAKQTNPPFSTGAIIMISLFAVLGFLCFFGTFVDELIKFRQNAKKNALHIQEDGSVTKEDEHDQPLMHASQHEKPQPFWVKFVRAFSITHNWSRLSAPVPGSLNGLNGLRVMSMFWIILGHTGVFMANTGVDNLQYTAEHIAGRWGFQFIPAGEFAVDTFFYLSAFLTTYFTLQTLQDKGRVSWSMYFFHRFWRLTPVYLFVLFLWWQLSPYFVKGPLWFLHTPRIEATCGTYWWTNVLYINNFWPTMEINMCLGWSWYLAVDMQFYIFSPIFIYLFYKNRTIGWIVTGVALLGSFAANIAITDAYDLNYNLLLATRETYYNHIYTKPYARAPPYLLGIMAAVYYLTLEKRGSAWLKISRPIQTVGYILAAVCMLVTSYATKTLYEYQGSWTVVENILYISFSRFVFVFGVAILMHFCFCGYGGVLKDIFEWSVWTPLARLTYTAYLLHPVIIWVTYCNRTQIFHYDGYIMTDEFISHVVLAYSAAAGMFLLLEKPMMNLESVLFRVGRH